MIDGNKGAGSPAVEHDMFFHLDLVSYSLPFFNNGPGTDLQFEITDAPLISALVKRLLELQAAEPARFPHSSEFLRSIPDWLLLKAAMRVPCDAYEGLWIGADGTVQLCDAAFPLGNINDRRLREIMFSNAHGAACRNGFQLKCCNCMCRAEQRISKHTPSVQSYR